MAKRASNDFMDSLFAADENKPRRRRVAAPANAPAGGASGPTMAGGPSGPAMAGGPSGPAMAGGPSGPAMSGGLNATGKSAPAKRRKRLSKGDLDALYG
ncbi:MAG: hypothetical protein IJT83_13160 [Victivallales bacterium]|nr:hypothetical protein [Victivallales bacterium]MBR4221824.1 hypothetical protein [Victivallales bacterium]